MADTENLFFNKWHKSGINALKVISYVYLWMNLKRLTVRNILFSKQIYFLNYPNWQKSKMAAKIWKFSTQNVATF